MSIALPSDYGYVLLAAASTPIVNIVHAFLTSSSRKAAGIKYPISYASAEQADKDPRAFTFNCAQRAHANFTENLTPFLAALLIAGLKYPVFAGTLGGAWSAARLLFAIGYTSNGPKGRIVGSVTGTLINFALVGTSLYTALGYALNW
jgi:glutathione S-transferase